MLQVISDLAVSKGQQVLREFNDVIPTLRAVGLGLSDVSVKLGFPPEVAASLTGSVDTLDRDELRALIERNKSNRTLTIILEALVTASNFKDSLISLGFQGLRLDIRIGLFPHVKLGLLPTAVAEPLRLQAG